MTPFVVKAWMEKQQGVKELPSKGSRANVTVMSTTSLEGWVDVHIP
jgi:hypothetical protein